MRQRTAFERLALPHMAAAYNLAYWLTRNRADAEDVVQDAYVRALRAFASFRGDDIKPWLLTIVRNVAYRSLSTRLRSHNVISMHEAVAAREDDSRAWETIAAEEPSAETLLIRGQEQDLLRVALAALPPAFREVLVLREIEEMSYGEIAAVIGSPMGTVMSRLSRARRDLKAKITALTDKDDRNAM